MRLDSFPVTRDRVSTIAQILGYGDNDMRVQNPDLQKTKSRRNPRWFIRPYVPHRTADGKVKQKQERFYLGACSEVPKRKAIVLKNERMALINRQQWVAAVQLPFGQVIDLWLKTFVWSAGNLSRATQMKYQSHVDSRIRPEFGAMPMGDIDTRRVDGWLSRLAEQGLSFNTRKDIRNTLSGIFTKARKWGIWREANPATDAEVGRARDLREKRKLSNDQLRRLLAAVEAPVPMICKLALLTLRISEVLALQEKHLDFETHRILIRQRSYVGTIDVCKTAKSVRDVPMGILAEALRAECTGDPNRYLFPGWTYNAAQSILRDAAKAQGIYWIGFGFHSFRRLAKTGLGAAGLDPFQTMKLAGHASPDLSLLYTLNDDEAQDRAVCEFQKKVAVN